MTNISSRELLNRPSRCCSMVVLLWWAGGGEGGPEEEENHVYNSMTANHLIYYQDLILNSRGIGEKRDQLDDIGVPRTYFIEIQSVVTKYSTQLFKCISENIIYRNSGGFSLEIFYLIAWPECSRTNLSRGV